MSLLASLVTWQICKLIVMRVQVVLMGHLSILLLQVSGLDINIGEIGVTASGTNDPATDIRRGGKDGQVQVKIIMHLKWFIA